ncbi:[Fe-Fe] hydrogenase large subunit C-terminal domain-containing protein [Clostridium sp. Marseille-Q2269]|uniref:[Fe-Fe] hydrogenase large subunit C-terminal domain-containing protein n=1 Tax=Clostridium sp. Marseille-Q2269 TaxID=2942205 RepID=UPI002072A9DD|nr:[Fe-Fe] hydrogenase large subunit C-terminal domain-containing protein [Clostridium sp. Marseille-Q2269]
MKKEHSELFKSIINSYVNETLESDIEHILLKYNYNKENLCNIISSLCGVEVDSGSDNFIESLNSAIKSYSSQHKIVNKIKNCSMDCNEEGGKTLCQDACPFDAILINKKTNCTYIDTEKCTDCGFCVEACPTGSILDKVEFIPLVNVLKSNKPVVAAVAPAIIGQFGENVSINQLRSAFKKLGFSDMIEVAFFADMLTLKEAIEFDHLVKNKEDLMITSCCCPMWVAMVKRVYGDLVKYVSPSISPMIAAGRVLKTLNPDCKVVFVGPCIAKKAEAKEKDLQGDIDFVLTFSELKDIFDSLKINVWDMPEDFSSEYASRGGRLYARTGGVSIAVEDVIKRLFPEKAKFLKAIQGNGVIECKKLLSSAQEGKVDANFIEGMGCIGGCVGGPKAIIPKEIGKEKVDDFANKSSIKVSIDSSCMDNILKKLNIDYIEDFKNPEKIKIFERKF